MKILIAKHYYKSVLYHLVLHAGLLTLKIEHAVHQNIPLK